MAFPKVQDADTKSGTVVVAATPWTVTYPTNLVAGDLVLAFLVEDQTNNHDFTLPAGWILIDSTATGALPGSALTVWGRVAVGTETGDFSATPAVAHVGAWLIYRVTEWFGTGIATWIGKASSKQGEGVASNENTSTSPNTNPNPLSLDPSLWWLEETLWFAVAAWNSTSDATVFPTGYTNTVQVGTGNFPKIALGRREAAVVAEDPGAFTLDVSTRWVVFTVAVRPAAYVNVMAYLGGRGAGW